MSKKSTRIGVLTSGGDAPGMNAAINAVVRSASANKIKIFGIKRGYEGLMSDDIFEMNLNFVSDIIQRGGTIIYTSRSQEIKTKKGLEKAMSCYQNAKLDALIIIGGNGSLKGAKNLCDKGINCIFIPGSIDNDIGCSDYTVGFDTAINTAMEMIDRLMDTAKSHRKCSVVEVMGRNCGEIALYTGIGTGATAILVPETPYNFEKDVFEKIIQAIKREKQHIIIVVSEGLKITSKLVKEINAVTGIKTHSTVLGYVQRGGSPTLKDRAVAAEMGFKAVQSILQGKENQIIAMKSGRVTAISLNEHYNEKKVLNTDLYDCFNGMVV